MRRRVRRKLGVDADIIDLADYIARTSLSASARFLDVVPRTLDLILRMPGIGGPKFFPDRELEGVRSCAIKGFRNHLIFYRPDENGILVLAVLHGRRDVGPLLSDRARQTEEK